MKFPKMPHIRRFPDISGNKDASFGLNKDEEKKEEELIKSEEPSKEEAQVKCTKCGKMLSQSRVVRNKYICYECGGYFRVKVSNRIKMVADPKTFKQWFSETEIKNPLNFEGYVEKIKEAKEKTGLDEAVTIGECKVFGEDIVLGVCDSRFMMSSMGHVVGEKITKAIEMAAEKKLPVFLFCCSGGARMQEGIISLMQMAKTSAAIKRLGEAGGFYCPILTDPTTGGVTASFAMLGDVIMAEPGALIGFAGPRVIKQTIGQELPEGFQTAEFLLEHGFIDGIVKRKNLKKIIYFLVKAHKCKEGKYDNFGETVVFPEPSEIAKERAALSMPLSAWDKVKTVRSIDRLSALDYMEVIFDIFVEAHGDRGFRDDPAIVGGIGFIGSQPVTVIADHKGRDMQECKKRNFGMPMPEGYRKALRLMKQAEKFNRPIVCFVNTPGAYPGIEAEERGMGESIARNLLEMSALTVPVLCILIGEGGSGGALATAVGNEVWMLENSTYSILSPEGFASILWKDSSRAEEASEVMKITAQDLKALNVIDEVIPEFGGATDVTKEAIGGYLKEHICEFLAKYEGKTKKEIMDERYDRFRAF
ncbi:MAG: acetyl-CoA carboxylase carboxyltransferase subunit alpha [Lachnospiraceae bacterium]|nr:acetyl-CoA carboxylase carboxyltransferase subunit alpha [Lachnospiraceae bacterium]